MAKIENLETGKIGLIQQNQDGRILQIGLTDSQSNLLQLFLAKLSEEKPFIKMPKEYDLTIAKKVE